MEIHPFLESGVSPNHGLWYVLSALGDCPSMRVGHTAVHMKGQDGTNGKVVFVGGANPSETFSDIHILDLETLSWNAIAAEGFTARYEHACFAPVSSLQDVYVIAGATQEENIMDVQCFNMQTETWRKISTLGTSPSARTQHSSAVIDDCCYLYSGGKAGADPVSDRQVHRFDANTCEWTSLAVSGESPTPRHGHTMCAVGQKILIFGGMAGAKFYGDLHILDTVKCTWDSVKMKKKAPAPSARAGHVAVSDGSSMYVFGGMNKDTAALDDTWRFDVETSQWQLMELQGPPPASRLDLASCVITWNSSPESASSTTKEEVLDVTEKLANLTTDGSGESANTTQISANITSAAADSCARSGEDVDGPAILLLVHGGMDTQGEIFDDCLLYRLGE